VRLGCPGCIGKAYLPRASAVNWAWAARLRALHCPHLLLPTAAGLGLGADAAGEGAGDANEEQRAECLHGGPCLGGSTKIEQGQKRPVKGRRPLPRPWPPPTRSPTCSPKTKGSERQTFSHQIENGSTRPFRRPRKASRILREARPTSLIWRPDWRLIPVFCRCLELCHTRLNPRLQAQPG
jgi:hypothetical protein